MLGSGGWFVFGLDRVGHGLSARGRGKEEQNCNYRWRDKIKEEKYTPAKAQFKRQFDAYLDTRIRSYMERHSYKIGKTLYK